MVRTSKSVQSNVAEVDLGENPVNSFQAREYAKESSPSPLAVVVELTENARDNATQVTLTIDVKSTIEHGGQVRIIPSRITCTDNGTGMTHREFLQKFCGAFSDSESHHEVDRAGRNGVGTKTYTSICDRVLVRTTTARPTDGIDDHRDVLTPLVPGAPLPADGEPDVFWRAYEFRLHKRKALPALWEKADADEMGTTVELIDLLPNAEFDLEVLIERLSFSRQWLENPAHSLKLRFTGDFNRKKEIQIRPWRIEVLDYLTKAIGSSRQTIRVVDPNSKDKEGVAEEIPPAEGLPGDAEVEFDFRIASRRDGTQVNFARPALLLEVCGALPYATNPMDKQSARTMPLLTFLGLSHSSSIGAFCNVISGYARVNSLELKQALRNNKTTLASGPGAESVEALRFYLATVIGKLHRVWYNATRVGNDEATKNVLRAAAEEVNLALKGANRGVAGGLIPRSPEQQKGGKVQPSRRHRWECGACERRWLADVGFIPTVCAETTPGAGPGDGCGSTNIGAAKNQPRVGDCEIRLADLGNARLPATFQMETASEDLDLPVVTVNIANPRFVELRGGVAMSGQSERRLGQYFVDVCLFAIAEHFARERASEVGTELGTLYYNRMMRRSGGVKEYERTLGKIRKSSEGSESLELEDLESLDEAQTVELT